MDWSGRGDKGIRRYFRRVNFDLDFIWISRKIPTTPPPHELYANARVKSVSANAAKLQRMHGKVDADGTSEIVI